MRLLEFKVVGQQLSRKDGCDFRNLVVGSSGYLKARFYFSNHGWSGCTKAASFWLNGKEYAALLDDTNTCTIPSEALVDNVFYVSVTGARSSDYKITTNKIKVRQEG